MNFMKKNSLCVVAALSGLAHASVVVAEGAQQLAAEQSARPLSAFFGLDNNLPFGANVLCLGAWGVRYALNQGIRLEQIVNDLWLFSTLLQTREIDYSNEVPDLDLLHQQILDYIEDAPTEL